MTGRTKKERKKEIMSLSKKVNLLEKLNPLMGTLSEKQQQGQQGEKVWWQLQLLSGQQISLKLDVGIEVPVPAMLVSTLLFLPKDPLLVDRRIHVRFRALSCRFYH
jgi:hypothetical protein